MNVVHEKKICAWKSHIVDNNGLLSYKDSDMDEGTQRFLLKFARQNLTCLRKIPILVKFEVRDADQWTIRIRFPSLTIKTVQKILVVIFFFLSLLVALS